MQKLGFWGRDEGDQIRAINNNADELGALQYTAGALHEQVIALHRVVGTQRAEIDQLKAALQAVCDLIVDLDLIDAEALRYRIEASLIEVAAARRAASTPASPFDSSPSAATAPATAGCRNCGRSVPTAEISFTDRGPMCDACVAALAAEEPASE